jgi:magnesium chelatase family protein
MVAHVTTVAFEGLKVTKVDVQVQVSPGLPTFIIVGLPDKAVAESKERVRAALSAIGLSLPTRRVLVNLAPADLNKIGSHFDLPIAIALLVAMKILPQDAVDEYFCMGELGLDGKILPVSGVLPASIEAKSFDKGIICPEICGREAVWAGDISILAAPNLLSLINHFKGTQVLSQPKIEIKQSDRKNYPDIKDIKGQENAKRALEIAAAGGHNILMMGPPGAGKSMLSSRLIGLLPPLEPEEILEVSVINSVAGRISEGGLSAERPYRDPHHSTSMAALVGGGKRANPGEISLAHKGVLFLDELPEFNRDVLESLRQPIETGQVTVARANTHVTYPARFQLVAAMNPCRCGYIDDADRACTRAPKCAQEYQCKISGPLYDRLDIFIEVPALSPEDMMKESSGESSEVVSKRVAKARQIQIQRYKNDNKNYLTNAEADGEYLEKTAAPDAEGKKLLMQAVDSMKISMRGYNRILRVARTIADLEGSENIQKNHIAEAISYRQRSYR